MHAPGPVWYGPDMIKQIRTKKFKTKQEFLRQARALAAATSQADLGDFAGWDLELARIVDGIHAGYDALAAHVVARLEWRKP